MNIHLFILSIIVLAGCNNSKETEETAAPETLPFLGEKYYDEELKDTVYHQIPEFELLNQDSVVVTEKDFAGKIMVADFFFTSCETICPKMTSQLKRVAKKTEGMPEVFIVSHTVDPETDSVATLKNYAHSNGIDTKKWWFLTGDESFIHEHGGQGYLLNVLRDSTAQGGFLHSEFFVLVDKERRIRGIYDGTSTIEVDKLIADITRLRKEYEPK